MGAVERDLIMDGSYTPTYDEIFQYIDEPARDLWQEINSFVQHKYNVSPKIAYSKCSAKPGWNIKYQKSGKSICTLYPEKEGFVSLVVILLSMVPIVEAMSDEFETQILETIKSAKPFNGTLWLMIQVKDSNMVDSLKRLLSLKHDIKGLA